MKKNLFTLLLMVSVVSGWAQEIPMDTSMPTGPMRGTKSYHLQKHRQNLIAGCVLVAAGTAALIATSGASDNNTDLGTSGMGEAVLSMGCFLASVPFFIFSAHHSKKAAQLSAGAGAFPLLNNNCRVMRPQASLSLKLPLGR